MPGTSITGPMTAPNGGKDLAVEAAATAVTSATLQAVQGSIKADMGK